MTSVVDNNQLKMLMFESMLENSKDLIFMKDANLTYIGCSKYFLQISGHDPDYEVEGKTDYDIFDKEFADAYTFDDRKVIESGVPIIDKFEQTPAQNGKRRYSSTSKFIIKDELGNAIGIYGTGRDITAQVELEEERECRELSREMFEDVLEADITENKMLRAEGSSVVGVLGLDKDSTFAKTVEAMANNLIHSEYADEFRNIYAIDNLLAQYEKGVKEFSHITKQSVDGKNYRWTECKSRLYFSRTFGTLRLTTFLKDADDEIKYKEKLKFKAKTDALTELLNREAILEEIQAYYDTCTDDAVHAMLFVDMDKFKLVNDNLGHPFGDKVLREMAQKLKMIIPPNAIAGRIGGDEFLVFIKDIKRKEDVYKTATDIFINIPFYQYENDRAIRVTCSIGVSLCKCREKSIDTMYFQADKAMYKAKENGRNGIVFHEEG